MVKLHAPLMSIWASGIIHPGVQLSQSHNATHLTKSHKPPYTHTYAQLSIRTYVAALAGFWKQWAPAIGSTWTSHPQAGKTSPYHAFLAENHMRRMHNLWPIAVYGIAPSGSPPTAGAKVFEAGAQRISLKMIVMGGNKPCFSAGFVLPYTHGLVRPLNVQAWDYENYTGFRQHHIRYLDPGTYSVQWFFIDGFGQISSPVGGAGLVVTP